MQCPAALGCCSNTERGQNFQHAPVWPVLQECTSIGLIQVEYIQVQCSFCRETLSWPLTSSCDATHQHGGDLTRPKYKLILSSWNILKCDTQDKIERERKKKRKDVLIMYSICYWVWVNLSCCSYSVCIYNTLAYCLNVIENVLKVFNLGFKMTH